MSEKVAAPKKYDFRGCVSGTVIPIETSNGLYYLEKMGQKDHDSALDNWRVHTTKAMGETTVQLINLIPNPNGETTWSQRADMKEQGGIGYVDEGIVHELGKIGTILDSFAVRETKAATHVKAA
jgi:hypothetical protein